MTCWIRSRLAPIILALLLLGAGAAAAECAYNGAWYPEGTRVGAFVCQGGQWLQG